MWRLLCLLAVCGAMLLPGVARAEAQRCAMPAAAAAGQDMPLLLLSHREADGVCTLEGRVDGRIGFILALPMAGWNGKLAHVDGQFAHLGCTGRDCGGPVSAAGCAQMLRRGYACMVNDTGDRSSADARGWIARGDEGKIDFAFRATHRATGAAKALAARFYGRKVEYSYFLGCSIDGRQGLIEAQHFPADYDGIVAGAPATRYLANLQALEWNVRALLDKDGHSLFPAPDGGYLQPDLRLLHAAIIAACDAADGAADGILADPRRCRFDPATLQCAGAKAPTCLNTAQVEAVRRLFAGRPGSRLRAMPGSEVNWGYSYLAGDGGPGVADRLAAIVRQAGLAGDDVPLGDTLYAADDPDLSAFAARGGRLLLFQGWSDHEVLPQAAVDYRDAVVRAMGGEAAAGRVLRLFMIPGMDHCGNGAAADKIDYVDAIERWTERGEAPDRLVAARVRDLRLWPGDPGYWGSPAWPASAIEFSRAIYPYPARAIYAGHGDLKDAASFVPAGRAQ